MKANEASHLLNQLTRAAVDSKVDGEAFNKIRQQLMDELTSDAKPETPKVLPRAAFRAQLCWLRDRVTPCAQDRIFDLVLASDARLRELLRIAYRGPWIDTRYLVGSEIEQIIQEDQ